MPGINLDFPEHFHFRAEITLRSLDLDNCGHLSSQALLTLMHEAWVKFLRSMECQIGDVDGAATVITAVALIHEAPCTAGDSLGFEMAAGAFSTTGCDIFYRITKAGTGALIARARTAIEFVDPGTTKPVAVPARFQNHFARS